jgi:hypothetical protein
MKPVLQLYIVAGFLVGFYAGLGILSRSITIAVSEDAAIVT